MQQNLIENISKTIARLPGMGLELLKRILLHLASNKEKTLIPLIENLQNLFAKFILVKLRKFG